MKEYSTWSRSLKLEPHYQVPFRAIHRMLLLGAGTAPLYRKRLILTSADRTWKHNIYVFWIWALVKFQKCQKYKNNRITIFFLREWVVRKVVVFLRLSGPRIDVPTEPTSHRPRLTYSVNHLLRQEHICQWANWLNRPSYQSWQIYNRVFFSSFLFTLFDFFLLPFLILLFIFFAYFYVILSLSLRRGNIVVNGFELQSRYYVHFRTKTLCKGTISLIPSATG